MRINRLLNRADACKALFICGLSSVSLGPARPTSAAYYDLETALALAPLFQLRAAVAEADNAFSTGQLREGYFQAAEGAEGRARAKKLLRKYKPREQGIAAIKAEHAGLPVTCGRRHVFVCSFNLRA